MALHGNSIISENFSLNCCQEELDAGSCSKLLHSLKPSTQLAPSPGLCLALGQSSEPEEVAAATTHGCPCTALSLSPCAQPRLRGWQGWLLARQQQERVQTHKIEGLSGMMGQDLGQRGRKQGSQMKRLWCIQELLFTFLQLRKPLQGAAGLAHGHLQGSSKSESECLYHLSSHSVSFAVLQAGCIHSLPKSGLLSSRDRSRGSWGLTATLSSVLCLMPLSLPSCSLNPAGRNPSCPSSSPWLQAFPLWLENGGEPACAEKSPIAAGGERTRAVAPTYRYRVT